MPTSPTPTCRTRRARWRTCWRGRARRFVVTYHSDIVRQRVLGALYRPFLWQVLRQARLIAVSNPVYIQDSPFLRRYADKCRVIHFGLNLDRFAATPEVEAEAAAWRARYGGRPLLLFVGRLRHYKGVNVLIEAMEQLPEATALIVGVGPMAEEWQQQAAAAGLNDRVHFLGEQPTPQCWRCITPPTSLSCRRPTAPRPLASSSWRRWRAAAR